MRFLRKIAMTIGFIVMIGAVGGYAEFFFDFQPPMARLHNPPLSGPTPYAPTPSPDGNWVVAGDGRTFAGYRIGQKFMGIPIPEDAVGHTKVVTGALTVAGTSATGLDIKADLTQLHSHKSMRDNAMHTKGLETDRFPDATFHMTAPADFQKAPALEEAVSARAEGDLTLHGVTRHVEIPVDAQWTGTEIEVAGHLTVSLADYGMQVPSVVKVVRAQDHGDLEFDLFFKHP